MKVNIIMIITTSRLGGERFLHLLLMSVMDLFSMLHGFSNTHLWKMRGMKVGGCIFFNETLMNEKMWTGK